MFVCRNGTGLLAVEGGLVVLLYVHKLSHGFGYVVQGSSSLSGPVQT